MTCIRLRLYRLMRSSRSSDKGQALVELALSLPVLVLILLGAVEFGRFAYLTIELTNAAKAAAQYGGQNDAAGIDAPGMLAVAALDAPEVASQCKNANAQAGFDTTINGVINPTTVTKSCACVTGGVAGAYSSGACTAACGGYIVQRLTITTSAQCTPLFYPQGLGGTITLSGNAVQEVLK